MIRRAQPSDCAALVSLERAAAAHPWSEEAIATTLLLPTTRAWIAGDPPHGYLLAATAADQGEVLILGVRPDRRREGVGRALLGACTAAWQNSGVGSAFLEVRTDNQAAIRLYETTGWTLLSTRKAYYSDGTDALVYRLGLASPC